MGEDRGQIRSHRARSLATVPFTKNPDAQNVPLNAEAKAALAALPRHGTTVLAWPWGGAVSPMTLHYAFRRV